MRRRSVEERYLDNIRRQRRELEEFAEMEIEYAGYLILYYGIKKLDIPYGEYRACAFFQNREYLRKPGSLALMYETYLQCVRELPEFKKELVFDLLRYRFKMYAAVLEKGGV